MQLTKGLKEVPVSRMCLLFTGMLVKMAIAKRKNVSMVLVSLNYQSHH